MYLCWQWSWPPCSCCAAGQRRCIDRQAPALSAGTPLCCSAWSACSPVPPYGSCPVRGLHTSKDAQPARESEDRGKQTWMRSLIRLVCSSSRKQPQIHTCLRAAQCSFVPEWSLGSRRAAATSAGPVFCPFAPDGGSWAATSHWESFSPRRSQREDPGREKRLAPEGRPGPTCQFADVVLTSAT